MLYWSWIQGISKSLGLYSFFTPVYTTVFIFRSSHYILLVWSSFSSRLLIYLSVSFLISSIHSLVFLPLFLLIQSFIHYFLLQFNQTFLNIYHFAPFFFWSISFICFISFFFLRSSVHSFKIYQFFFFFFVILSFFHCPFPSSLSHFFVCPQYIVPSGSRFFLSMKFFDKSRFFFP